MHPDRRHDRTTVAGDGDDEPTSDYRVSVRIPPAGDEPPTTVPGGGHPE
jgi:hypothetical protein